MKIQNYNPTIEEQVLRALCVLSIVFMFLSKCSINGVQISSFQSSLITVLLSISTVLSLTQISPRVFLEIRHPLITLPLLIISILVLQFFNAELSLIRLLGLVSFIVLLTFFCFLIPQVLSIVLFYQIVLICGLTLLMISALMLTFGETANSGRFSGLFLNPGIMGNVSSIIFVLLLCKFFIQGNYYYLTISSVPITLMILSGGRTSIAQSIIAVGLLLLLSTRIKIKNIVKIQKNIISFLPFIIIGSSILAYKLGSGQLTIGTRQQLTNGFSDRIYHWLIGVEKAKQKLLLGDGVLTKFNVDGAIGLSNFTTSADPHNLFIYATQVGGLGMLTLIVLLIFYLTVASINMMKSQIENNIITGTLMISFIAGMVFGGSLFSLNSLNDRFFWLLTGYIALAQGYQQRKIEG